MIDEICTALADVLAEVPGLRVYDYLPGQVEPPAAMVRPDSIAYASSLQAGSHDLTLVVLVLVSGVHEATSQRAMRAFIDPTGETSIPAAIAAEPTLGDVVDDAKATSLRSFGQMEYAGIPYLAAELVVEVLA